MSAKRTHPRSHNISSISEPEARSATSVCTVDGCFSPFPPFPPFPRFIRISSIPRAGGKKYLSGNERAPSCQRTKERDGECESELRCGQAGRQAEREKEVAGGAETASREPVAILPCYRVQSSSASLDMV